jgi:hypothetical protein
VIFEQFFVVDAVYVLGLHDSLFTCEHYRIG